jgi:Na+/melibiose symporter-like transporter
MAQLRRSTSNLYGVGQMLWGVKDTAFHYYLFFYYQQVLGLSGELAGAAAFIAILFDALSDPLMGHISDNWRSKEGRRHPFLLIGALLFSLPILAIFNPPADLGQMQLFAWYLVFAIVVRTVVTIFATPHMALGAELSDDYQERTRVFGTRVVFGFFGGLIVHIISLFILLPQDKGGTLYADGYQAVGLLVAFIGTTSGLISWWGTRDQIPRLKLQTPAQDESRWYDCFRQMWLAFELRNFRVYMLASLSFTAVYGLTQTMTFHVSTFYFQLTSEQQGGIMLSIAIALIPAYIIATSASNKWGKRGALLRLIMVSGFIGTLPVNLALLGMAPPIGSSALYALILVSTVVSGAIGIANLSIAVAMVPDMIDEYELLRGTRQEGIFSAAQTFSQKVSFGVGTFFAGMLIAFTGLESGEMPGAVSTESLGRLAMAMGPALLAVYLLISCIYLSYRLDEKRLHQIHLALGRG